MLKAFELWKDEMIFLFCKEILQFYNLKGHISNSRFIVRGDTGKIHSFPEIIKECERPKRSGIHLHMHASLFKKKKRIAKVND